MNDELSLFFWYAEMRQSKDMSTVLLQVAEKGEDVWKSFEIAIVAVTYKAVINKMSPYMFLQLYRMSFFDFSDHDLSELLLKE